MWPLKENKITAETVQESLFLGKRIGDMTREELFDVIAYFEQSQQYASRVHQHELDVLSGR